MIHRRTFLTGLASLFAAPAIVKAGNIMKVRALDAPPIITMGMRHYFLMSGGEICRLTVMPNGVLREVFQVNMVTPSMPITTYHPIKERLVDGGVDVMELLT